MPVSNELSDRGPHGGCHRSADNSEDFISSKGADLRNDTDNNELARSSVIAKVGASSVVKMYTFVRRPVAIPMRTSVTIGALSPIFSLDLCETIFGFTIYWESRSQSASKHAGT